MIRRTSASKDFIPRLDRISESPENHMNPQTPATCDSEDFSSVFGSALQFEFPQSAGQTPHCPSAFASQDVSQSYPNLVLSPQAPFSPYHLTWITPCSARPVMSDTNIHAKYTPHAKSTPVETGMNDSRNSAINASGPIANLSKSWKSPYHPPCNTPNNSEANTTVPSMLINTAHSEAVLNDTPASVASSNVDAPRDRTRADSHVTDERGPPPDYSPEVVTSSSQELPSDLHQPPPPYDRYYDTIIYFN